MSDAELDAKVQELSAYGAPFVDPAGLIAAVRGIEDEADPTRLLRLTVPDRPGAIDKLGRMPIASPDDLDP